VARISHAVIAAQLRERPGEWAWICTRSTAKLAAGTAHSIRLGHGLRHYAPSGAFEATARTVVEEVDGKKTAVHKVFARFVGEGT
jgi:hypothetical protein